MGGAAKRSSIDFFYITDSPFHPAIGINEDLVTGNANGPLGAYLVYYKLVKTNGSEFYFKG